MGDHCSDAKRWAISCQTGEQTQMSSCQMMYTNGREALGNPQTKCLVTAITLIHCQLKPNAGIPAMETDRNLKCSAGAALLTKVFLSLCAAPNPAHNQESRVAVSTKNRGQQSYFKTSTQDAGRACERSSVHHSHSFMSSLVPDTKLIIMASKTCYNSLLPSFETTPVDYLGCRAECYKVHYFWAKP